MRKFAPTIVFILSASTVLGEGSRQLDAHEHGVGKLNIAIDGDRIAMELEAPGADIVGFEYSATSAEDRASVDAAVATLARPLDLFALPAAAGCSVVEARASLESDEAHEDHEDRDHEDGDNEGGNHGHADHADENHNDKEHAGHEHGHEDEDHENHADHNEEGHDHTEHEKDDHDHEAHAEAASHTEFHADYMLTCADPEKANFITFAYFDTFPNALELEVQVISGKGATAFEVERDAPTLDLRDMF